MAEQDVGHIRVHRRLLQWEWFQDSNTVHVLLYLLLRANWQPKRWKGHEIAPGQLVTSRESIAETCGLSAKQVRLALEKLNRADVITTTRAGQGQLITLRNWADYQVLQSDEGRPRAGRRADRGPIEGRPRATTKEGEESEEGKKGRSTPNGVADDGQSLFENQDFTEPPNDRRDPEVQELIDYLTETLRAKGIAQSLDVDRISSKTGKGIDGNRAAARHLLNKLKRDYPTYPAIESAKRLVDFAASDPFHGPRSTKVGYLYRNLGVIAAQAKQTRNGKTATHSDLAAGVQEILRAKYGQ